AVLAVLLGAAALVAAGCASSSNGGGTATSAPATSPTTSSAAPAPTSPNAGGPGTSMATTGAATKSCSPSTMQTHTGGEFTVATDSPAYPPWFIDNKPSNGKGFESAVAYAVAKQLGYPADKVTWVTASFTSVIAPTPKPFDFAINEFSITAKRAQ